VKFLSSRGLGFRGDNEMLGSQNNTMPHRVKLTTIFGTV